jgi:L-fuconolactonase
MPIVDAQVHAWSNGVSTGHHRRTPITGEVLKAEMAQAGVDRALLVPPLWDPDGNAYSLALAEAEPQRFAVMGLLDSRLDNPDRLLRTWREQPNMRGIRFLFNTKERLAPLLDGELDGLWPIAEETGLVVALLVPNALHIVGDLARRHPQMQIIVDHLGVPRGASGPGAFDHLPALLALADHPNVHVKAAGVRRAADRVGERTVEAASSVPPMRDSLQRGLVVARARRARSDHGRQSMPAT